MPIPSAVKIVKETQTGCVNAKPRAEPINGAVQGVATTVASAPLTKEPNKLARWVASTLSPVSEVPTS